MLPGAGPWVHDGKFTIECESPLYAEAAPESEAESGYVSFEHDPNWSMIEGRVNE
jgi:hypothetical protein